MTALYFAIPQANQTQGGAFGGARNHRGIDLRAVVGTPVFGAADVAGVVAVVAKSDPVYGYMVAVNYELLGHTWQVVYGHLSRIDVVKGQSVWMATQVGLSGGRKGAVGAGVSEAPHFHQGLYRDLLLVNPINFLNQRPAPAPAGGGVTPIPSSGSYNTETDMRLARGTDGTIYFTTASGVAGIETPAHLTVLQRWLQVPQASWDTFNAVEIGWIIYYINKAQNDNNRHAALLAAIAKGDDAAEIAAAVKTITDKIGGQSTPAPYKFADDELAKIGTAARVDLTPVIAAIDRGDKEILAAIASVDEATLATFGLKRA